MASKSFASRRLRHVDPGEEALHDQRRELDGEADLIGAFDAHDLDGDHGGRGDLLAGEPLSATSMNGNEPREAHSSGPRTMAVLGRMLGLEHEAAPVGVDRRVALAPLDLLAAAS